MNANYIDFVKAVTPAATVVATKDKYVNKDWFKFGEEELKQTIRDRDELISECREIHGKISNSLNQELKEANKKLR